MSLNLKSSVSMTFAIMSSMAFVACAKSSDNKPAAAAPAQTAAQIAEVKQDAAKRDCPEIMGTYVDSLGKESIFSMASIPGGMTFTQVGGESTVVDGKTHSQSIVSGKPAGSTYTSVCKDGEVQTVLATEKGETFGKIAFKVMNEAGDVQMSQEIDGVATTAVFKKVKDVQPAPAQAESEANAKNASAAPGTDAETKSETKSETPVAASAPSEASQPAKENSVTPVVETALAPIHIPTVVDRETHSPVDTPAQVPANQPSDAGQAPPMPEAMPSQSKPSTDYPDYFPDLSNKHGFKGN